MTTDEPGSDPALLPASADPGPVHDPPWPTAREQAHRAVSATVAVRVALPDALGGTLADEVVALADLPPFDTVSMDGWAVCGPEPWCVVGRQLAGAAPGRVGRGEALEVATGSAWPSGAERVLRRERGAVAEMDGRSWLRATGGDAFPERPDVRQAGEEAVRGDVLLPAGHVVTPPVLGLVAAAGHDTVLVHPRPRVAVAVLGDELLASGLPGDGRVRDALSVQLPGWVAGAGGSLVVLRRVTDTLDATEAALHADADLVVTTGGTARGPVDQLHAALAALRAELLVDGVAVRPGHPMLLARVPGGPVVVGLPGNPLAAAVGFVGLGVPALLAARGLPVPAPLHLALARDVSAPPTAHRVVPAVLDRSAGVVTLLPHTGPAMLRGLADATHLAVVPPGGAVSGDAVDVLPVPWSVS
jgi:molybdopterin molybdotransferase